MRAAEMAAFFAAVDWARLGWIMVRSTGGGAFRDLVRETIGPAPIEGLETPFAAVCCDLTTGDEVVLREGSLEVLMRAFHIMQYNLSRMRSESTRTIEPEVGRFGWFDFQLAGEIMDEGYRAYREDGDAAVR
jgi:predicted acylesterase/phospholipase RssA